VPSPFYRKARSPVLSSAVGAGGAGQDALLRLSFWEGACAMSDEYSLHNVFGEDVSKPASPGSSADGAYASC